VKKLFFVSLLLFCGGLAIIAQEYATTSKDNRTVILNSNGTWFYSGEEPDYDVQILEKHFSNNGIVFEYFGRIRNNTDDKLDVKLLTGVYDENKNLIGVISKTIDGLSPHKTAYFNDSDFLIKGIADSIDIQIAGIETE